MDYLEDIGEFFIKYGPWAVVIFEGWYILYITKQHRKDRIGAEERRLEERKSSIETYNKYHDELMDTFEKFSNLNNDSTAAISSASAEIRDTKSQIQVQSRAIEQLLMVFTAGVIKVKKPTQSMMDSISNMLTD